MKLGLDAGTYSIKAVLVDEDDRVICMKERVHHNKVKESAVLLLNEILGNCNDEKDIKVKATGAMSHLFNLEEPYLANETKALCRGIKTVCPDCRSAAVLGASRTMYIDFEDPSSPRIVQNSNCSAGTGSFFEEQATRLQINIEDISEKLKEARQVPSIAGRCSVFSKTDMIHRMQEGFSTADILMGLSRAVVRNYKSSILKNKRVSLPLFAAGGLVRNEGIVKELEGQLGLKGDDLKAGSESVFACAIGAAVMAFSSIQKEKLFECIKKDSEAKRPQVLKSLGQYVSSDDRSEYRTVPYVKGEESYLGIDIGSTSINLVLVNSKKEVIYYSYVKTLGLPLDIVKNEIKKMEKAIPGLSVTKKGITGSGREYVGKEIGADLVINEITAQTQGAVYGNPSCDTVFEIGGQDSKYMKVADGLMADFEMNKVCAAGTGAFLEEQIKKLGLSIQEFIDKALESRSPVELGDRCTVFIEGSINRALASGCSMEDVCAGLCYAIVSNYLNRVVGQKSIGSSISLQGGIAYNEAVICAFRSLTGKKVQVSPYFSVTGALGAAILCMEGSSLAFDREKNRALNGELLRRSEASYLKDYKKPGAKGAKKRVGIPRVIFLHKMFPLFNTLFTKLGYEVILSPLTDQDIIQRAQNSCPAETCYPVKLIYGHISWLLDQDVDFIVLPRLYTIKHEGSVARHDYSCVYMQTSPLLMEQAFGLKERGVKLLMPVLSLQFGKKFMVQSLLSMSRDLDVPKPFLLAAAVQGFASLVAHAERLEAIGRDFLNTKEPVFVLVSRVYNIIDPVLNMGIEEYLVSMGCRVIHLEHLEASYMNVAHDYKDMYWPFGQHILTGLKLIRASSNLYPIYITNHGCGPDTAIQHFFQNEMKGRQYLQLEVDEHSSKVGLITRLEAFLYSIRPQKALGVVNGFAVEHPVAKPEAILVPDLGIYTDILVRHLENPSSLPVIKAKPLEHHRNFSYAMNKEYYTMLMMTEEILNAVKKEVPFELVFPIDEGSEVFGQYGLLIYQELLKRGYDVTYRPFYLEDLVKREDYIGVFSEMMAAEKELSEGPGRKASGEKGRAFVLGEALAVMKEGVRNSSCLPYDAGYSTEFMALSEALLFHMRAVDRKDVYKKRLLEWKKLHDEGIEEGSVRYSCIEEMEKLVENRLDFMIGGFARYRFAKLLSLKEKDCDLAVALNSAEENAGIVLKQMTDFYRKEIKVSYLSFDLDFTHSATEEDYAVLEKD